MPNFAQFTPFSHHLAAQQGRFLAPALKLLTIWNQRGIDGVERQADWKLTLIESNDTALHIEAEPYVVFLILA